MIKKIISGGQSGADKAGLLAAHMLEIETGGHAPKNYKTEYGFDPSLKQYNLEDTISSDYKMRTRLNIANSDGTIIFGSLLSTGSKFTKSITLELEKPLFIVQKLDDRTMKEESNLLETFLEWINSAEIKTLNVAGNRESKNPGIQRKVFWDLIILLQEEQIDRNY